jgi:hypothetical protein
MLNDPRVVQRVDLVTAHELGHQFELGDRSSPYVDIMNGDIQNVAIFQFNGEDIAAIRGISAP